MSETLVETKMCPACETELTHGICLNADCPEAQAVATAGATTERSKQAASTAGTKARVEEQPRSFARRGYAD